MPRSIVENLSLLPHAELCLVLIVHRIQPLDGARPPAISDQHWQKWTGLKPRMKEMAIRGLKEKGLTVAGDGDKARYYFDPEAWARWVRTKDPAEKGRVTPVKPKPKQKIHPDCTAKGCQRLCETHESREELRGTQCNVVSITPAPTADPYVEEPQNRETQGEQTAQYIARLPSKSNKPKGEERKGESTPLCSIETLLSVFLNLGVQMSGTDITRMKKMWAHLKPAEQTAALAHAQVVAVEDWVKREIRFIPRPWNYLQRKEWERTGPVRKRKFLNPFKPEIDDE